jgi:uncharacterized protein (DUF4213/DUF364 family)
MSSILNRILDTLADGWNTHQLYIGQNWTLLVIQDETGRLRAGLAATPSARWMAAQTRFRLGENPPTAISNKQMLTKRLQATDPVETAVGLAALNASLKSDLGLMTVLDAADWLVEHSRGRQVALVGRFPFVGELRPVVTQLWVLELSPQPGEYSSEQAPLIIPQADVVAITSSTLINHTLDDLLALARPEAKVMLLGPSTPLTPVLFEFGVDLLSGVQVVDVEAVRTSVAQGVSFRHMAGVRRVTMQG